MPVELKVPAVGESITEVEIGEWLKHEGETIAHDENLVALESEKATVELPAPVSGSLAKIFKQRGEKAAVGEVIGLIEPVSKGAEKKEEQPKPDRKKEIRKEEIHAEVKSAAKTRPLPPAQRVIQEEELSEEQIESAALGGRMPKEEELRHVVRVEERKKETEKGAAEKKVSEPGREEEVVPMTPLRRTVAQRLVEAQQTMAILTTFNEIDMSAVMVLRKEHQETFTKKFGVKLGFMSFFVKASVEALKNIPQLNAFVRGGDIVYHNYFDIGVAIASEKGLVVPILKNAERMSFAEIEKNIADFAARAQQNKLKPDELHGGTFTISNGGVFGSLLSTPIINPPQSGILGMHTIQERPVARDNSVVIRPIMYVALSYDHRIVDGREAVLFLQRVKDVIENPARMLLEI